MARTSTLIQCPKMVTPGTKMETPGTLGSPRLFSVLAILWNDGDSRSEHLVLCGFGKQPEV